MFSSIYHHTQSARRAGWVLFGCISFLLCAGSASAADPEYSVVLHVANRCIVQADVYGNNGFVANLSPNSTNVCNIQNLLEGESGIGVVVNSSAYDFLFPGVTENEIITRYAVVNSDGSVVLYENAFPEFDPAELADLNIIEWFGAGLGFGVTIYGFALKLSAIRNIGRAGPSGGGEL